MEFNTMTALHLGGAIERAETVLRIYLFSHFPKGARCTVRINANQINPTPATIVGIEATTYGGRVMVKIDTAKPNSRFSVRSISTSQVFDVKGGAA